MTYINGDDLLQITADHPIFNNNHWCLPTSLKDPELVHVEALFNVVLSDVSLSRTVVVGGFVCCTLGMSVPGFEDQFWGSEEVISWVQHRHDYPNVITFVDRRHSIDVCE